MSATVEHYDDVAAAFDDTEQLTVLVVVGASRDQVAVQLDVDLTEPVEEDAWADSEQSAWALLEIPGGVVAAELSGFGDPSNADLAALSAHGAAAVTRNNILAHYRFGCARAGELLFDDNEYIFIADPDRCPTELRPLFDLVHDDLTDDDIDEDGPHPLTVGLAMAEQITGLHVTPAHIAAMLESGFFAGPSQRYAEEFSQEADTAPDHDHDHDDQGENETQPDPADAGEASSHLLQARTGMYAITEQFPGTMSDPPASSPAGSVCVAVDDGTSAWIRKLSADPDTPVAPLVVSRRHEPTDLTTQLAADPHVVHGSVVLRAGHGPLHTYDDGAGSARNLLTEGPGLYNVHVFARPATNNFPYERHTIVVWPHTDEHAADARPDVGSAAGFAAGSEYDDETSGDAELGDAPPDVLAAHTGMYAIGEHAGTISDPPDPWPANTLCVKVGIGSAWVRKLGSTDTPVRPFLIYWDTEPTGVLSALADESYDVSSHVELAALSGALHLFDDGRGSGFGAGGAWTTDTADTGDATDEGGLALTDRPGDYNVRVFARPPRDAADYEQHILVVWPAATPDTDPDTYYERQRSVGRTGMYAIAADATNLGERPADWPDGALLVTVRDTVWIRRLDDRPDSGVRLYLSGGDREPTESLELHRAAGAREGSALLTDRGALSIIDDYRIWGDGEPWGTLTAGGYTAQLRVFAVPAAADAAHEEHYLYVWPDPPLHDWPS